VNWYLAALRQYATFQGRAHRTEFWIFTLVDAFIPTVLFGSALAIGIFTHGQAFPVRVSLGILFVAYELFTFVPAAAVRVRRLHDTGRSGAYYFISLIPVVGPILLLIAYCTEGTDGPNQYGLSPRRPTERLQYA
jgi:uncharacterized membrane protein YhaH (DUF805 family)